MAPRAHLGRLGKWTVFIVAVGWMACGSAARCAAEEGITRIEEHWKVELGTASAERGAPQLNFLISPSGDSSGKFAVFIMNQRDGQVGGLQLQLWNGEELLASDTFFDTAALAGTGETISWTTRMSIEDGQLRVEIVDLHSWTWGDFGDSNKLSVSTPTSLANLNHYNVEVSIDNFGIDFGENRVEKVTLKKVIGHAGDEELPELLGGEREIYP